MVVSDLVLLSVRSGAADMLQGVVSGQLHPKGGQDQQGKETSQSL